ncbi:MAG: ROK family protein [Clostridia bacterium]|nr:ROK family protein [Clostridia bacterium]
MKYLPLNAVGTGHAGYQQQVKEGNIKRIFDLVRSGKCKSRADLVRVMNLSATSVSVLVEELASRRLIDETGPTQTSLPGRRPICLRLNSDAHQMVVFTLQRDGVGYTLLNLECKILERSFFPLDASLLAPEEVDERYLQLFENILFRQAKLFDADKTLMLGICYPGIYAKDDHKFHMDSSMGICLTEEAVSALQKRIRLPIYLSNSTKSLAYAEKKRLDAINPANPETLDMLFMEISDGIGCAIISRGDIYTGPYDVAGEIGHVTIDYKGRPCPCGNVGCLERYVNLCAILEDAKQAAEAGGIEPPQSFAALAERYESEPVLLASVNHSAALLASGLYSAMCGAGMRRVVLGGGIEALGEAFLREVYRAVCTRKMLIHHLDLSYAQIGPDAESIGIAHHFLDKVFTITS